MENNIKFKDIQHLYLGCQLKDQYGNTYKFTPQRIIENALRWSKPILRKLDSMTEEEKEEVQFSDFMFNLVKSKPNQAMFAWQFTFLLSKHFDLFNLIKSGEAIDAETLKEKSI
jgi:hypothetical protein